MIRNWRVKQVLCAFMLWILHLKSNLEAKKSDEFSHLYQYILTIQSYHIPRCYIFSFFISPFNWINKYMTECCAMLLNSLTETHILLNTRCKWTTQLFQSCILLFCTLLLFLVFISALSIVIWTYNFKKSTYIYYPKETLLSSRSLIIVLIIFFFFLF